MWNLRMRKCNEVYTFSQTTRRAFNPKLPTHILMTSTTLQKGRWRDEANEFGKWITRCSL